MNAAADDARGGDDRSPAVGMRWLELAVAAVLMGLAAMVIADSLRVGIGWADDGPRSGYFPFYIGLLLLLASASIALRQLLHWRRADPVFATRAQLGQVASVALPLAAYVGAIFPLGIYVASAVLIGFFMKRLGRYGWAPAAAVALAVPALFFLVFERWFLVPLPKGPLERLLGL